MNPKKKKESLLVPSCARLSLNSDSKSSDKNENSSSFLVHISVHNDSLQISSTSSKSTSDKIVFIASSNDTLQVVIFSETERKACIWCRRIASDTCVKNLWVTENLIQSVNILYVELWWNLAAKSFKPASKYIFMKIGNTFLSMCHSPGYGRTKERLESCSVFRFMRWS